MQRCGRWQVLVGRQVPVAGRAAVTWLAGAVGCGRAGVGALGGRACMHP